jgi:hypothetical protein
MAPIRGPRPRRAVARRTEEDGGQVMEQKPLHWRLVVFVVVVGFGFAVNVWQCVSLLNETKDVLVITVTTSVGTVIGIGLLGYMLDPFDRWKAEREKQGKS